MAAMPAGIDSAISRGPKIGLIFGRGTTSGPDVPEPFGRYLRRRARSIAPPESEAIRARSLGLLSKQP